MESNIISVMLWGEEVGKLYWDERSKKAVFNYHPNFIKKGLEIAPLTASVKGPAAKGMPILGNKEKIYQPSPVLPEAQRISSGSQPSRSTT